MDGRDRVAGGTRLQAYKHRWTRRYLHLDDEANAFAYRGDDLYREVSEEELRELFDLAVQRPDPWLLARERLEWEASERDADSGDLPTVSL